jgi:hypothetical protein
LLADATVTRRATRGTSTVFKEAIGYYETIDAKDDIQVKFCKLVGGIVKEIAWLVFILEEMEVQERHGKFRTLSLAVDSVFGGWTSVRNLL